MLRGFPCIVRRRRLNRATKQKSYRVRIVDPLGGLRLSPLDHYQRVGFDAPEIGEILPIWPGVDDPPTR